MKHYQLVCLFFFVVTAIGTNDLSASSIKRERANYRFTISMDNPDRHYFQVEMMCKDLNSEYIDLKMSSWTPGYYKIQDLCKNVVDFKAYNQSKEPLNYTKVSKNTWRVFCKGETSIEVSYQVYGNDISVVGSSLNASRAFISPTGVFLYPAGKLEVPVEVKFNVPDFWSQVSTGLDIQDKKEFSYYADNFDVLLDCPVLIGNQEVITLEVKGIPHYVAVSENDPRDKSKFIEDLRQIIQYTIDLMGDIPYKHYTFITLDSSRGGLEHANSCVLSCPTSVADYADEQGYKEWLNFVTHEYFHLYNVKSIRPIVLGPFNYDEECFTNMLWVSEGFTVYYEYLIMNRAGLLSKEEAMEFFSHNIATYENKPGSLLESVTSSSYDAWIHFFDPSEDAHNNTISYYTKGCGLGVLLDLNIRHKTKNKSSLDDVMRKLYQQYFQTLQRGFTDEEFQQVCEDIAGESLQPIFDYASTTQLVDYKKYFNYAGVDIDTSTQVISSNAYMGTGIIENNGHYFLHKVERNSPIWEAGLGNGMEIVSIDGDFISKDRFENVIQNKKAGEEVTIAVISGGNCKEFSLKLKATSRKNFKMKIHNDLTNLQQRIFNSWLK